MIFKGIDHWKDKENTKGLIFVAQLLDELLFEYTLDTYKPSAMNTSLLVWEARSVKKAIDAGLIKKPNLPHILDELCINLEKDEVAKALISIETDSILKVLKNKKAPENSWMTIVELLAYQLPQKIYKKKTEELLRLELDSELDFSSLRRLTRSYVTTLINLGFSPEFIRERSCEIFFDPSKEIHSNNDFNNFVDAFDVVKKKYKIIYQAPNYLSAFKSAAEKMGITIFKKNEIPSDFKAYGFSLKRGYICAVIDECETLDHFSAKNLAESQIKALQTLVSLFHHKQSPDLATTCLVVNTETNQHISVNESLHPMHKCKDFKMPAASRKLNQFMERFSMSYDSFTKFNRSAELHALSLSSQSRENQMINLWTAIESLLPQKHESDNNSNIQHIANSLMPFLNLAYLNKLIVNLTKDFTRWDEGLARATLKNVKGKNLPIKMTYFLTLDKYKDKRIGLEKKLDKYLLLKERFRYVSYVMSSPKNIINALDGHKQRIEWQLRRIYRARNLIVHEGVTPSYTDVLIENTHEYLDTVMNSLMKLATEERTITNIDQGFKIAELDYNHYYETLSQKNLSLTHENIEQLLFKHSI